MSENSDLTVDEMRVSLEALWSALDTLFVEMSPADWRRPHGAEWVFADLPFHLAYIDRLLVARPIELGEELPAPEQVGVRTLNELDAWNQHQFGARPEGQTVEESLEQMHGSRDYVRQVMDSMSDADLERPAWFLMLNMRGFRPALVNLSFCVGHTWQHMEEARVRHGHDGTMIGPQLTHTMLDGIVPGIPLYLQVPATTLFLDANRAREQDFSFAFNITGPGGGIWTFHPAGEGWQVAEAETNNTDLVVTLNLDSYIKVRYFISDLGTLVKTGEIEVSDEQAFSVYRQLFVEPDFDFVFPQMP